MNKLELKKAMEAGRFAPITDELFAVYDEYQALCDESLENNTDLLQLYFFKAETYFRLGDYQQAQTLISDVLMNISPSTPSNLLANCYNIMGLIYAAMGHELMAMENYLLSIDHAKNAKDSRSIVVTQVNIGWMYRDLGAYDKALEYFYKCLDDIDHYNVNGAYNLLELCLSYIGQISFILGDFEKGVQVMREVEGLHIEKETTFYEVITQNMFIRGYSYLKDEKNLRKTIDYAIENARHQEDFLEFCETYFDVCNFLITIDQESAKKMLEALKEHSRKTDLPFLNMKVQKLAILYAKEFLDNDTYLKECESFFNYYQEFRVYNREYITKSLSSIKTLQLERKEKQYYQERSRYDLMTTLLNKVNFTETVGKVIESTNFNITQCAMAIIDIDKFKEINDTFGHRTGDNFIVDTASMMKKTFTDAILGRIGGDEFCVFWPHVLDKDDIIRQTEELHQLYKTRRRSTDVDSAKASVSIGLFFTNSTSVTYETMFEKTDQALYEAKHSGRNQTRIYED